MTPARWAQQQESAMDVPTRPLDKAPVATARQVGAFGSILFLHPDERPAGDVPAPDFFVDLNLDQIAAAIIVGKQEYDLLPFFHTSVRDVDSVRYRHEVMKDLEVEELRAAIDAFAEGMRNVRERLALSAKLYYRRQKQRWFLDAVAAYCGAVLRLGDDLSPTAVKSRGLRAFREYATMYTRSQGFVALREATLRLTADLAGVRYAMLVQDGKIRVRHYEAESDYSVEVLSTFEKFRQGAAKDYTTKFNTFVEMNHVEAAVHDMVARLFPDVFRELDAYCEANRNFLDDAIATFDRDVQFYIAYLDYMALFAPAGLAFAYPEVSDRDKTVRVENTFDTALALTLIDEKRPVVTNEFHLDGPERVIVVTGPNQGGKTTFARTFGQLHYLAKLGCPVPGSSARLFFFDRLFTHFEREENIQNRRGKLQDDLVRIHGILEAATGKSIVIMNEIFTSTALQDALFLSRKVLGTILDLDALGVCVTFIDELASLSDKTVSMVSTVVPENPAERTFKVLRRPADGLAHAMAIARKYRLTFDDLKKRLDS
jgi:DNA mismatch repair protein MutS